MQRRLCQNQQLVELFPSKAKPMVTVKTSPPTTPSLSLPSFFTSSYTFHSHNTYIQTQTPPQQEATQKKTMAAGGGSSGGGGKSDDFQPFPVKDQLPGVDFCVCTSPSWRMNITIITHLSFHLLPSSLSLSLFSWVLSNEEYLFKD